MRKLPLIAALFVASAVHAQTTPPSAPAPDAVIGSAKAPLAPQEAEYIRILQNSRRQYMAAKSVDARRYARMAMQSAVHNFMGLSHDAKNWVGVFKDSIKNLTGTQSVEIEIAPGVTVATWDNPASDANYFTLFQQASPIGKTVSELTIGQEVTFSASLIGTVISGDDDMVLRPQVIAKFSQLTKIEPPAGK